MNMRWAGGVACIREVINAYNIVVEKPRWEESSWKIMCGVGGD